jgi:hypothetical protein
MAAHQVNITDRAKRNPQPWTLPKAERSYYVHGLHGAKTATLAGSYGTKTEAMKAARRLANEEGEDVSISAPKGAMIVVHPNPATRQNLFGFGKGKDARRTTPAHGGIAFHQAKAKSRKTPDDRNTEFLGSLKKGKAKKSAGASSMPSEADLQAGFKRGLSLADMLQRNPSRGEALEISMPYHAGQAYAEIANRNRTTPDRTSFLGFVRAWAKKHGSTAKDAEGPISDGFRATFTDWRKRNPRTLRRVRASAPLVWPDAAKCRTCKNLSDHTRGSLKYVCPDCGRVCNLQSNPASASAEVFEDFHGFEPTEVVTVSKEVHHHAHLASLGELVQLDVWGVDGKGHKVTGFKGALLACNEGRDQLFVEGGDQTMNLADFGIRKPHETETLGRVTNIGYQTNKTHLGDEGGEAVYVHRFRATNQNGKHVVVKMTREPDLIYDVRNEQLLFSGGSYEILREGINK